MVKDPRVDRFINLMEREFGADDIDLLYEVYSILKKGNLTFWEFLKPYFKASVRDPDLITRSIIIHDYLVIRLGYANGSCKITEGYTTTELKFILDDFEAIIMDLKSKMEVINK